MSKWKNINLAQKAKTNITKGPIFLFLIQYAKCNVVSSLFKFVQIDKELNGFFTVNGDLKNDPSN